MSLEGTPNLDRARLDANNLPAKSTELAYNPRAKDAPPPAPAPQIPAADLSKPINPLELIFSLVATFRVGDNKLYMSPSGHDCIEFPTPEHAMAALEAAQAVLPHLQHHLITLDAENTRLRQIVADQQRVTLRPLGN